MLALIIVAIAVVAVAYFLYKKFKPYNKPGHTNVIDPNAQKLYDQKKHPENEEKSLSMAEKIELSWEFLTQIAEKILSRFSPEDTKKVDEIGHKLNQQGMRYMHDVNMEVNIIKSHARHMQKQQSQAQDTTQEPKQGLSR